MAAVESDDVFNPPCNDVPLLSWRMFFGTNVALLFTAFLVILAGYVNRRGQDQEINSFRDLIRPPCNKSAVASSREPTKATRRQGKDSKGKHRK
ncbi:hypothetical protein AB1Y20_013144 [Prymnesium parvum]|uniref:Uncharacterized protein n=1 Tax=Prymnesium parvum TaxID=97485 RepID=A0AB34IMH5_PRYPA|mmetsp:Transcript_16789/g.40058  ORF Transcript_16789/g.40058 Transcript_16789/m.40058 type:complete len:94 (-) Transcript_16789:307-588(-)